MAVISTRLHGAGDYATGAALLAAPMVLRIDDALAGAVLRGTGMAILGLSAMTDYEVGLRRRVPMRTHLLVDGATGAMLAAGALALRRRGRGLTGWAPHGLVGVGEIVAALITAREPGDRGSVASPVDSAERATGTLATADEAPAPAATEPPATTPAPPQPVPRPVRRAPTDEDDDILVARAESAAAAEAAMIGGQAPSSATDPAMDPVYQAGGGEQDGWEQAEAELIENATHGDGHAHPESDAFTPEVESDLSTAAYGEADGLPSTEVAEDRGAEDDVSGRHPRP